MSGMLSSKLFSLTDGWQTLPSSAAEVTDCGKENGSNTELCTFYSVLIWLWHENATAMLFLCKRSETFFGNDPDVNITLFHRVSVSEWLAEHLYNKHYLLSSRAVVQYLMVCCWGPSRTASQIGRLVRFWALMREQPESWGSVTASNPGSNRWAWVGIGQMDTDNCPCLINTWRSKKNMLRL